MAVVCAGVVSFYEECMHHYDLHCRCGFVFCAASVLEGILDFSGNRCGSVLADGAFSAESGKAVPKAG